MPCDFGGGSCLFQPEAQAEFTYEFTVSDLNCVYDAPLVLRLILDGQVS